MTKFFHRSPTPVGRSRDHCPPFLDSRAVLLQRAIWTRISMRFPLADPNQLLHRLVARVARLHPRWTAMLGLHLRQLPGLRTNANFVLAHAALVRPAVPFVSRALSRFHFKAEDLLQMMMFVRTFHPWIEPPVPLRDAIRERLGEIDEVCLLKLRRVPLVYLDDMIRLCRPRPKSRRRSHLYRYLRKRSTWSRLDAASRLQLPAVAAYEAIRRREQSEPNLLHRAIYAALPRPIVVSRLGSTPEVWSALAPRLSTATILRQLGEMRRCGALDDEGVRQHVRVGLTNWHRVRSSRVLPFRWHRAWTATRPVDTEVASWLEIALEHSVANLPHLPGLTVVACDHSASMRRPAKVGSVGPIEFASLVGAVARQLCEESVVLAFGEEIAVLRATPDEPVLTRARRIRQTEVGQTALAHRIPEALFDLRRPVDRLLVLTDGQLFGESGAKDAEETFRASLRRYRDLQGPHLRTFIVDLAARERVLAPEDRDGVTRCSGWCDGVLRIAAMREPIAERAGQIDYAWI